MKKLVNASRAWGMTLALIATVTAYSSAAFTSKVRVAFSAAAVLTSGGSGTGGALALSIPSLLPVQAFFGKNIEIPIQMQGPAASLSQILSQGPASGVNVQMVYQQMNSAGATIGGPIPVPVTFQAVPNDPNHLDGTAIVPVQNIQSLRQNGTFAYHFILQNGPAQTIYQNGAAPFQVQFIDTLTSTVDNGSIVTVPDTALGDGKTSVVFGPGSLGNPGSLMIKQVDPFSVPGGPAGLPPILVYMLELQGTSLLGNVQVTLSYPSNPDGSIIGSNGNPSNLSLYGLQGPNWVVLGPSQWNSSLHTVTGPASQFTTYALFLAAGNSAAELRPRQRVITPNGDGINDSISFLGIGADSVRIFDIKGRRVRTLQTPNLVWDGREDDNRIAESGLYIYQYSSQGDLVSGVILIAK